VRTISASLQTEIDAGRIAKFVRVVPVNEPVFGVTNHNKPITADGLTYTPAPALAGGALRQGLGVTVDNQKLSTGWLEAQEADLLAGVYDDAYLEGGIVGYAMAVPERLITFAGDMGKLGWNRDGIEVEALDPMRALGVPLGRTVGPGCPVVLGSQGTGQCNVDLSLYEVSVTVTGIGSNPRLVFSDSGLSEADDWFADGEFTWDTGDNAGDIATIELYASNQFTLQLPARQAVQVGDTGTATPGCDRTAGAGGCQKFNNRDNYQGIGIWLREEVDIQ